MIADADQFKRGMRRLASGGSIVTTSEAGERRGMARRPCARFPPRRRRCWSASIGRRFNKPTDREHRFRDRQWTTLLTSAPALVGALASFDT